MEDPLTTTFAALADPTRRAILERLAEGDATVGELAEPHSMSLPAISKHIATLERAGLITSAKIGRERKHYLNPIPIQHLYDRWVSKYAGTWTGAMTRLKYELEDTSAMTTAVETTTHVYEIFIRTTPDRLWQALTDGDQTAQYYFGTRVQDIDRTGADYQYTSPDGSAMLTGKVIEADPPRKLVITWRMAADPRLAAEGFTRLTYEIVEGRGGVSRLSVIHELAGTPEHAHMVAGNMQGPGAGGGWSWILSDLKTLLETGEPAGG